MLQDLVFHKRKSTFKKGFIEIYRKISIKHIWIQSLVWEILKQTVYQWKYYSVLTLFYGLPVTDYLGMTTEDEAAFFFFFVPI